ncbi:MAG: DUF2786 domain-containing protein, partial [Nitrospinae bacterium]|nr:DUF2786 domain-containing protein [Nitrospinota bacterium]
LAESSNLHEAESAMKKARELLLKHNISLLEVGKNQHYSHKEIGQVGRKSPISSLISTILNKFFFVETIWIFSYDQHTNKKGRKLKFLVLLKISRKQNIPMIFSLLFPKFYGRNTKKKTE